MICNHKLVILFSIILLSEANVTLPPEIEVLIPDPAYEACGYQSCPTIQKDVVTIHIVPHSHTELGYDFNFDQHFTGGDTEYDLKVNMNVERILDSIIMFLWMDTKRRFTWSDMAYFYHWWSKRDGTVHRMVYQLVRQGRLYFVGGGLSLSDEAATNYQGIIDHHTYSLRKINDTFLFCGRPLVAWQVESYGHSREVASLMAQMGYDGLFINPISYDDEISRMNSKSLEFLWRGSDDLGAETDIYTNKLFDGYWSPPGFLFGALYKDPLLLVSNSLLKNIQERIDVFLQSTLYRQAPYYTTKNIIVMMGARMAYWDAVYWFENTDKLISYVNGYYRDKVNAVYSTPACYLKAVHDSQPTLAIKQDDFFPIAYDKLTYLSGHYTTRSNFKYLVTLLNVYLQISNQLQVLASLGNNNKLFEEVKSTMGIIQDHHILSGALSLSVQDYYVRKILKSLNMCTDVIIRNGLNILRSSSSQIKYSRCLLNISSCVEVSIERSFIVVYNPLSWHVSIPIRIPSSYGRDYHVHDPKGNVVEAAIMKIPEPVLKLSDRKTSSVAEIVFTAKKIPPLGFRSYFIKEQKQIAITRYRKAISKPLKKKRKYIIRQVLPVHKIPFEYDDEDDVDSRPKPDSIIQNLTKIDLSDDEIIEDLYPDSFENLTNAGINGTKLIDLNFDTDDEKLVIVNVNYSLSTNAPPPQLKKYTDLVNTSEDLSMLNEETTTEIEEDEMTTTPQSLHKTSYVENNNLLYFFNKTRKDMYNETDDFIYRLTTTPKPVYESSTDENKIKKLPDINANQTEYKAFQPVVDDLQALPTTPIYEEDRPTKSNIKKWKKVNDNLPSYSKNMQTFNKSKDLFIQNKFLRVDLDPTTRKISKITHRNSGLNISLNIEFYYYEADDPKQLNRSEERGPGPLVFKPLDSRPISVKDFYKIDVFKSNIAEEIHIQYSNYTSYTLNLYEDSLFLEVDWLVGPLPIEDGVGIELFIRYSTDLINNGVFFTDANGRQTIKRIIDKRVDFNPIIIDEVAANIYPVTSKIYIEDLDRNIRFSVFNDRCQGGTSLHNGKIDLMLLRRLLTDDGVPMFKPDEPETVRGKHYIYFAKANYKPNKIFEKKVAKEIQLRPQILVSSISLDSAAPWLSATNEFTALKSKIPLGVHILTLDKLTDTSLLLRFENYLEKADMVRDKPKVVFLKDLFANLKIMSAEETTLAANQYLEDWVPLQWQKERSFVKNLNNFYGNSNETAYSVHDSIRPFEELNLDTGISLEAQQIRTFIVEYVKA